MTDPTPATVAVPVELIKTKIQEYEDGGWPVAANEWRALLPKPNPRLVAVDLDHMPSDFTTGWLPKDYLIRQPDLLAVLNDAVELLRIYGLIFDRASAEIARGRIRAALGVNA